MRVQCTESERPVAPATGFPQSATYAMEDKPYRIVYDFCFSDGRSHHFVILLDAKTGCMIPTGSPPALSWTRLDFEQCRCCPLDPTEISRCPVAVNIADIVETFKDKTSSESCKIRCEVQERIYLKKTTLMEGISSIFGIIMATSCCPVMDFFKPMARFHLPFSTGDESTVRAVSMFLLGYYLQNAGGGSFHMAIKDLEERYARVRQVNEGLFARITHVGSEDADKNAIIMLHSLSMLLGMEINQNLDSITEIFMAAGP
jgi:hypothetical protein